MSRDYTFHDVKNRQLARVLDEKVDLSNDFRTVTETLPNGDRVILRTRGGHPEMITIPKKVVEAPTAKRWVEVNFDLREYGPLTKTTLHEAMGGFIAMVRPITKTVMQDQEENDQFDFMPFNKVETT